MKIQCLRRPKSCCAKCCIPFFIMLIMVMMTFISGLETTNDNAYGLEYDYIISNTGDGVDSTSFYPMHRYLPWPDSNGNANQWIQCVVCGSCSMYGNDFDLDVPSYLAVVAVNVATLALMFAYESIVTLPAVVPSSPDVTAKAN